ncbi:PREDICTED: probable leucine-rich repeat receptor-like serine/threonine-protein kinase At3g14840 isoform X2 [Nelumbo nucifera]|uniref:non-specific serine/threonine protein kinase n=1 Tax=Nelumbo nucifera TaxID=4432 RepID=A0A1U8AXF1_NELNU|nr:PREDICTED: probable leucine-rich repeat receptor-like serine/threonine-protein kinase At3g14840 isoform X2 [Nelumbo nucifera]
MDIYYGRLFLCSAALVLCCFGALSRCHAANKLLPEDEVGALREIAKTLHKVDWNFGVDPCINESSWLTQNPKGKFNNNVTCDCSYNNGTTCHVISMILKNQNLSGRLPPELANLPYLQHIDFRRNFLNGTIPVEWASMKNIQFISLVGNRISGEIPKEIGKMANLTYLSLEANQLSGAIPSELGDLIKLKNLSLSSNNFSGTLPSKLANLINLKEFSISDNNLSGPIPDFIQNWTHLDKMVMQASGLEGPIPSVISVLQNLTDLRISDIHGNQSTFPDLGKMKGMRTLILRNCNISDTIPSNIWNLDKLKIMDLSFNKLKQPIPNKRTDIEPKYIYLTGNMFEGAIPEWMLSAGEHIDLSYNSFTWESLGQEGCMDNINLFRSMKHNWDLLPCSNSSSKCTKYWSSLHINCGGPEVTLDDGNKYEGDKNVGGASKSYFANERWGFSSTGNFIEIVFTNDNTFSSLGRRLFDIYIQGKLMRKDFDIEHEAGGAGKEHIEKYNATVTNNTLEIRFYWAGKGTTIIPARGYSYGPLISAISVEHNFKLPSEDKTKKIVIGVAIGAFVSILIILVLVVIWWKGYLGGKNRRYKDLRGLDLQTGSFTLRQIKAATNNFDAANKIGEGGFGSVYKGQLLDGTLIAVKQLSSKSKQGNREFVNEIGMISGLQHPNLVKLYGCCIEEDQLLLVYEYMENNSLSRALFGPDDGPLKLDWPTRQRICVGIARGLAFLHEESRLKIVHRDIKGTNVLLDRDLNPKISDFGLAKLDEEEKTHISTQVAGTIGYMAPEYALWGHLTFKADVYSFGVVALEIVSGRTNSTYRPKSDCTCLLDWAFLLQKRESLLELVDPRLGSDFNRQEVERMIKVALLCITASPTLRPSMSQVVSMLEGSMAIQDEISDPSISGEDSRFSGIREYFQQMILQDSSGAQTQNLSSEGTWISSSSLSVQDVYLINPHSP